VIPSWWLDAVNSKEEDASRRGHLIDDIWAALHGFQQWQMLYIRRTANRVAHALARVAVKRTPLICIADLLVSEQLPLPLDN
jgi:hypothetical protein